MNKYEEIFLSRIIAPIIVLIIAPTVISFLSYSKTGDFWEYLSRVPTWVIILFIVIIGLWFLRNIYLKRKRHLSKLNEEPHSPIIFLPSGGYDDIGEINLFGLKWIVRHPRIEEYEVENESNMWNYISPESIFISYRARCPKCGTELEEKHTFWGRIKLSCPRGDFTTYTKFSLIELSKKVEKIAKRDIEKEKMERLGKY